MSAPATTGLAPSHPAVTACASRCSYCSRQQCMELSCLHGCSPVLLTPEPLHTTSGPAGRSSCGSSCACMVQRACAPTCATGALKPPPAQPKVAGVDGKGVGGVCSRPACVRHMLVLCRPAIRRPPYPAILPAPQLVIPSCPHLPASPPGWSASGCLRSCWRRSLALWWRPAPRPAWASSVSSWQVLARRRQRRCWRLSTPRVGARRAAGAGFVV